MTKVTMFKSTIILNHCREYDMRRCKKIAKRSLGLNCYAQWKCGKAEYFLETTQPPAPPPSPRQPFLPRNDNDSFMSHRGKSMNGVQFLLFNCKGMIN